MSTLKQPLCGHCGYSLRGLPAEVLLCPECGAHRGTTPKILGPLTYYWVVLTAISCLVFIIAFLVSSPKDEFGLPSNQHIGIVEVALFAIATFAFLTIVSTRLVRNVFARIVVGVFVGTGLCFQLLLIAWILGAAF